MSIGSVINTVSNAVQNAARTVEQKTEQTAEQLTPKLPPPVIPDAFERARSTAGTMPRLFDSSSPRRSVVSAGVDAFAGWKEAKTAVSENGDSHSSSMKLGVEGGAAVFAGTVNGVKAGVQAGFEVTEKDVTRTDLGDGRQLKHEATTTGLWGAVAKGGAQLGTVTGASLDVFAGARGGGEQRWAVVDGKNEAFGVAGRAMAMVGVGVKVDGEAGYDVEKQQVRLSGGVGAALGVGGYVGGEVTVGGPDEAPRKEVDLSRAIDLVRGRIHG